MVEWLICWQSLTQRLTSTTLGQCQDDFWPTVVTSIWPLRHSDLLHLNFYRCVNFFWFLWRHTTSYSVNMTCYTWPLHLAPHWPLTYLCAWPLSDLYYTCLGVTTLAVLYNVLVIIVRRVYVQQLHLSHQSTWMTFSLYLDYFWLHLDDFWLPEWRCLRHGHVTARAHRSDTLM